MNNLDKLLDELLLPLTVKSNTSVKQKVVATPIYENGDNTSKYNIQCVKACVATTTTTATLPSNAALHFTALLTQITSMPTISEEAKGVITKFAERIHERKKHLYDLDMTMPLTPDVFEHLMTYIHYIGEVLPLFANNREPFVYQLQGNDTVSTIQHTSLIFEYLVSLWSLVSYMYSHLNLDEGAKDDATFKKHMNALEFCIHTMREMHAFASKIEKGQFVYRRFIYRASPSAISSKSIELESIEDTEARQHEKELALLTTYFGGARGIYARLQLFCAKKYEFLISRALFKTGIGDILGGRSSEREEEEEEDDESVMTFVTKENAGHLIAFIDTIVRISQHYGVATKKVSNEESHFHHYTFYRLTYWQCVAHFLKASVDYYQYCKEDRIEYGKHALKRAETIKTTLETFNHLYRNDTAITGAMRYLNRRMTVFFEKVNYHVKTMNNRSSDGVTLVVLDDKIIPDEKPASVFDAQMRLLHQNLIENDSTQLAKQSLSLLYKLKSLYLMKLDGGGGGGGGNTGNEHITEITESIRKTRPDDRINVAVSYERYNWLAHMMEHETVDTNGDRIIVIRDTAKYREALNETKEIIKENLLYDGENETVSPLSNKLSSHLYF